MMPCSCAASRACAICSAMAMASADGDCTLSNPIGQRRPLDQFHHQADAIGAPLEAVNLRDVRVIQRREDFGFGQNFDGNRAFQTGVGRPVDLAHSTSANERADFVGAKPSAGQQRHSAAFYVDAGRGRHGATEERSTHGG